MDVLLLLDVSASMRPHVQRISSAAHEALRVLGDEDRVAIMVFDRATRLRLPFTNSLEKVERDLESLLNQETFNGGTDITLGMLEAARYVGREGRRDTRRAIVILTDDQTERARDEEGVSRALTKSDAVLSALLAPYAMRTHSGVPGMGGGRRGGGSWPGGCGGSWPGGGGGGSLGGIILGPRGPYGGRGGSGPYGGPGGSGPVVMGRTRSAGTAEIARHSGGDSMSVDDASALETTLSRIRQRYALHFYLPQGVKPGEERAIEVALADSARQRYPDAEVRYRRVYLAPSGSSDGGSGGVEPAIITQEPRPKRRPGVNQVPDVSRDGPYAGVPSASSTDAGAQPASAPRGVWRRVNESDQDSPQTTQTNTPAATDQNPPRQGGWRKARPDEQ